MNVELLSTTADDGLRLDGALHAPAAGAAAALPVDALLFLHGVGSNFYGGSLFAGLTPPLLTAGAAVLWANTRGHDGLHTAWVRGRPRQLGAAYEIVDECRLDVAAWVRLLGERGFQRIGVLGHSLGAIKAVYAQARAPHEQVVGVAAASPPRLSHAVFHSGANREDYREALARARQLVEQKSGATLIEVRFPFPLVISAGTFVDKYGPGEHYNILKFVDRVACPLLFTYGAVELAEGGEAFAGLPELLAEAKGTNQRLDVEIVEGANHNYSDRHGQLGEVLLRWLYSLA
jgi:hypothetical protein